MNQLKAVNGLILCLVGFVFGVQALSALNEERTLVVFSEPELLISFLVSNSESQKRHIMDAADYDADGHIDLLLSDSRETSSAVELWLQGETGQFLSSITVSDKNARILASGDVDGDQDIDLWMHLVSTSNPSGELALWLNSQERTFIHSGQTIEGFGHQIRMDDLNQDGALDLVVALSVFEDPFGPPLLVFQTWLNDESGVFTLKGETIYPDLCWPVQFDLADLNADAFPDLVLQCESISQVLTSLGDGTFSLKEQVLQTPPNVSEFSLGFKHSLPVQNVRWTGDLDGDGDQDVLVPNSSDTLSLWFNDGNGVFGASNQNFDTWTTFLDVGDLDGDGDDDALGFHSFQRTCRVFWNVGEKALMPGVVLGHDFPIDSSRLVDLDSDGDLDVLTCSGKGIFVFRNQSMTLPRFKDEEQIDIPNLVLQRRVRETLGLNDDAPITRSHMLLLNRLDLRRRRVSETGVLEPAIRDFSGLEEAVELRHVHLHHQADFPIDLLRHWKELRTLSIREGGLDVLRIPRELAHLESLDMKSNPISSISLPPNWSGTIKIDQRIIAQTPLFHMDGKKPAFLVLGPPGTVTIYKSTDLIQWHNLGNTTISEGQGGFVQFVDPEGGDSVTTFYKLGQ